MEGFRHDICHTLSAPRHMSGEAVLWIICGTGWLIWLLWILAASLADTRPAHWFTRRWDHLTATATRKRKP